MKTFLVILLLCFGCSSYKNTLVHIEENKILDNHCFWAQSIHRSKNPIEEKLDVNLYYCCPNEKEDNENIRPVCISAKFLRYTK